MNDSGMTSRLIFCTVFLCLIMTGLGGRLAFLHLGTGESVRDSFDRNRQIEKKLLADRGNIYDRKGKESILALSLPVHDICVSPKEVIEKEKADFVASNLSEILSVPVKEIMPKLSNPEREFEYVRKFAIDEIVEKVQNMDLPGVFFEDTTVRYYPHKSFMCHVLGFVNYEGTASAGIEQEADRYLQGSPGSMQCKVDARRRELYWSRRHYVPALEGADVYLTIDQNIQYIVEKALDDVVAEHHPKATWAIVQSVGTGEILAMASRPDYDLNEFRRASEAERLNRAIGQVYEPGSTMKALTIAAALNEGVVSPDTVFSCENGVWTYGGRPIRDYHPYGDLSVADILKKSSNIGAAKVALLVGEKRFYEYMKAFGFGRRTEIDLPGEEQGILRHYESWANIDLTRMAFGHAVAGTALQVLGVFSTIANDGCLMKPYVIREIRSESGDLLVKNRPEMVGQPITAATARKMRELLFAVTQKGGTGVRAGVEGYEVAGKTGTADKVVNGRYVQGACVASFAGFFPAGDPEVSMIVVIDEPSGLRTGGAVACPAFSSIAAQTARYLSLSPDGYRIAEHRTSVQGH